MFWDDLLSSQHYLINLESEGGGQKVEAESKRKSLRSNFSTPLGHGKVGILPRD